MAFLMGFYNWNAAAAPECSFAGSFFGPDKQHASAYQQFEQKARLSPDNKADSLKAAR
jgi:hypothetical protein